MPVIVVAIPINDNRVVLPMIVVVASVVIFVSITSVIISPDWLFNNGRYISWAHNNRIRNDRTIRVNNTAS